MATETTLDGITTYGYDAAGRLISASLPGGREITYAYDAVGNRTVVSDSGADTVYVANNLNQYTSAGASTFSYDADGNLTMRTGLGGSTTYTYDSRNRLTSVTTPTDTWNYHYDALGHRTATTHNGQTTEYLVDPTSLGSVLGEYDGTGQLVSHYTLGLGLTSRVDAGGNADYYDFDALGSTAGLTNATGDYAASYTYLPFGEVDTVSGSVPNPFQYVGQDGVMNEGNGLDFMCARFYMPASGRFLNPDPLGLDGGVNLYAYADNNPVGFKDPSGLIGLNPNSYSLGIGLVRESLPCAYSLLGFVAAPFEFGGALAFGPTVTIAGLSAAASSVVILGTIDVIVVGALFYESYELYKDATTPVVSAADFAAQGKTEEVSPQDPNFLSGPAGFGPQKFVPVEGTYPYAVYFENKPDASAPAQVVTVTQQLDADLDLSTFELGSFGFGDFIVDVPTGRQFYSTRVDATKSLGVYVDVTAELNRMTGVVTWTFTTIDPITLDEPVGVIEGFLPPDDEAQHGEGWVSYSIAPLATSTTGTVIDAQATVIFDAGLSDESSLDTPPVSNTIDAGTPASSVDPLPATTTSESFTVSWSGSDDAGGSGIASYDVYRAVDGGPSELWLHNTTLTSADATGEFGHTYSFYTVATVNVGHVEAAPALADAGITVIPSLSIDDVSVAEGDAGTHNAVFTVSLSGISIADVSVDFTTANGTAKSGSDYTAVSGTVTIFAGSTSATITVPILGDTLDEPDETFFVNLSNPTNAAIADDQATGTITDNDTAPILSINNVSVSEGDLGTTDAVFTVTLSALSGFDVTVDFGTQDNSAAAGSDYTAVRGTVTILAGSTSGTIAVPILGDTLDEPDETFFVNLSNAVHAIILEGQDHGVGTIADDDLAPLIVQQIIVNDGAAQRSNLETIKILVTGNADVQALIDSGDILNVVEVNGLTNNPSKVNLSKDYFQWNADTRTLTIDLTIDGFGGSHQTLLSNDNYQLRLLDSVFADTDGIMDGLYRFNFHRLKGDFTGDKVVNIEDRAAWFDPSIVQFNRRVGQVGYNFAFDFDGDGIISAGDYYSWLRNMYGNSLQ